MKRLLVVLAGLVTAGAATGVFAMTSGASPSWSLVGTNTVASSPVAGGGYPVPPGSTKPQPPCGPQQLNSNHSESWLAVKPGTEDIVGSSKFFIGKWSTFYDFHLGSYTILGGSPAGNNQVQGYECTTLGGNQDMPPSWTHNTDPNVDWDTQGRVYQTTLPFNSFWEGGLHPNGEIDVSYSDDMGRHWVKGNGGQALDSTNNQTSLASGHVEDKQWIAVNHIPGSSYQDHVYAMWTTFNGSANANTSKIMVAVSRDRGQTFSREVKLTTPSATTPGNTYVYPSIGPDGTVYVAFEGGFDLNKNKVGHIYVAKSTDDGRTWGPFVIAIRASTSPSSPTRTAAPPRGLLPSAATSGSRSSRGIQTSPRRRWAGSRSTRVPVIGIRARPDVASSATTSGSRSRTRTSTRSPSRRTTRRM